MTVSSNNNYAKDRVIPKAELNSARHDELSLLSIGEQRVTTQYLKAGSGITNCAKHTIYVVEHNEYTRSKVRFKGY